MSQAIRIRVRTEPKLKNEVERIFRALGVSSTEAINLFYQQVRLQHGLPFEIKIPNAETLKAVEAVDNKKGLVKSKNAKEMFKKLGIKQPAASMGLAKGKEEIRRIGGEEKILI